MLHQWSGKTVNGHRHVDPTNSKTPILNGITRWRSQLTQVNALEEQGSAQCNPVNEAATARLNGVQRSPSVTKAWRSKRAGGSSRV